MNWRHEEGTEGMGFESTGFESTGFESEWITNLGTEEEEGTDVTALTIIGDSITQHKPKHTKERQKERGSFWG
jgi:hypothetical protein